jgi:glucuronate isomerase
MWLPHVFSEVFGIDVALDADTADHYYDTIGEALASPAFRPRALFERFDIELLATTEGAGDDLKHHKAIRASGWNGRVVTTYRPDSVIDPEHDSFARDIARFAELSGENVETWSGYLAAHRKRRADFRAMGATATDHGFLTARTANLSTAECEALFAKVMRGAHGQTGPSAEEAELFRAQMLTEMARMSVEDGMTMQIHPGATRNHNARLFASHGRDKGADIPRATEYVEALRPMLDLLGNEPDLKVILFTLDETTYARELAPLAGHYPCLKLGPAWWFHDSPEGMRRFREQATETAGFYNTVGFNDDTRAFLSIPARHDVARRVDCAFLARLVAEHRMEDWEAAELAQDLAYNLAKAAYKL